MLAEFYVNATTKKDVRVPAPELGEWIDLLASYPIVPVDGGIVQRGIFLARRFQISYWDAALIAAAERLDAPTLYTEDLNHGQLYGTVRAVNPFLPA